jgi:ATP-dependent RNA helicase SUPV3L1/SUV3
MASYSLSPVVRSRGVTAVLGPTNTGKTHLAIERMLGHSSGLIGLPLRLLAREVYGRVVERVGADQVALITGEEKIKPANPRYWVATVEAMPRDLDVAFVAVDEIQLAQDFDRGHVFTDHLLNRRGREETLVLGSAIMRPLVEALLPDANLISRPRLSNLTYAGEKKLTRLPPRSAIVAFSAEEVYAIAELIRRQRGGAAVVMGALSPRTRNAQVALFQSGDVDHIIATDAIGMGLNLDIHHVAFAGDSKFDGHQHRRLTTAEFGQIAGRAGRHLRDGTFGTSGRCRPFDPELIDHLENHIFDPVRIINWRNPDLEFTSIDALRRSLAVLPRETGLSRVPRAEDEVVLDMLAGDGDIVARINSRDGVMRLWDMCALPDYRKVAPHAHAELVGQIFCFLMDKGHIPDDWFQRQISLCDRLDGDIDTLSARIAQIRTWTFCANRDWLKHPLHWQGVTRAIEDKLSDALHEKLTVRFVDRRTSVLMRRLRENAMLEADVTVAGDVTVEGQPVGRLQGFRFTPDASANGPEAKALVAAASKALTAEIEARAVRLAAAADEAFVLSLDGTLRWVGEPVAKLQAGERVLDPRFLVLADEQLSGSARESVETRLTLWLKAHLKKLLGPLLTLESGEGLEGISRGIAYQLAEHLGVLERAQVQNDVKSLDQESRSTLRKLGVRFGAYSITTPLLLKPAPRALAAQLWVLKHGGMETRGLDDIVHLSASGRTSIPVDGEIPVALYRAAGFRVCGPRAIRVDILERLADLIRPAVAFRPGTTPGEIPAGAYFGDGFNITGPMTSLVGCAGDDFAAVLKSLGYRSEKKAALKDVPVIPLAIAAVVPAAAVVAQDGGGAATPEAGSGTTSETAAIPADAPAEVAAAPEATAFVEAATQAPAAQETSEPPTAALEETVPAEESAAVVAAPAEPELVDVWRPARFERDNAPRRHHGRPQQGGRPQRSATSGAAETAAPSEGATEPRPQRRGGRKPWQNQPAGAEGAPRVGGQPQGERPPRNNAPGEQQGRPRRDRPAFGDKPGFDKPRFDKPRFDPRSNGQDSRGQDNRQREKQPDPDSPFAQLAVLKAQLEAKKDG